LQVTDRDIMDAASRCHVVISALEAYSFAHLNDLTLSLVADLMVENYTVRGSHGNLLRIISRE
jgi:hypothetical protein